MVGTTANATPGSTGGTCGSGAFLFVESNMITNENIKDGPFLGNGVTTSWPITTKIVDKTKAQVIHTNAAGIDDDTLVLDSDFSLTLNPDQDQNPGGTLTYPVIGSPLPSGEKLNLIYQPPFTQQEDLTIGGGFNPQVVENALDKNTQLARRAFEKAGRSVTIPVSDGSSNTELPTKTLRADKFLMFDSNGDPAVASDVEVGEQNTMSNVGTGTGQVFKQKSGVDFEMKTIQGGNLINVSDDTSEVTVNTTAEINTNSNSGSGAGLVKSKVGSDTPIKSIIGGSNVTIDNNADDITINASGGGGGGSLGAQFYNVTEAPYNVQINNPAHDATVGIQQAINDCMLTGGVVYIPPGTYYLDGVTWIDKWPDANGTILKVGIHVDEMNFETIAQVTSKFVRIVGGGEHNTILKPKDPTSDMMMIRINTAQTTVQGIGIDMETDRRDYAKNMIGVGLVPPSLQTNGDFWPAAITPGQNPNVTFDSTANTITLPSGSYWLGEIGDTYDISGTAGGTNDLAYVSTALSSDRRTLTVANVAANETIAWNSLTVSGENSTSYGVHNTLRDILVVNASVGVVVAGTTEGSYWDYIENVKTIEVAVGFFFYDPSWGSTDPSRHKGSTRHRLIGCTSRWGHLGIVVHQADTLQIIGYSADHMTEGIISGSSPANPLFLAEPTSVDVNASSIDSNGADFDTTQLGVGDHLTINLGLNANVRVQLTSVGSGSCNFTVVSGSITPETVITVSGDEDINYAFTRDTGIYIKSKFGPESNQVNINNMIYGYVAEDSSCYVDFQTCANVGIFGMRHNEGSVDSNRGKLHWGNGLGITNESNTEARRTFYGLTHLFWKTRTHNDETTTDSVLPWASLMEGMCWFLDDADGGKGAIAFSQTDGGRKTVPVINEPNQDQYLTMPVHTVSSANAMSKTAGRYIHVSDDVGGATVAFSDGTNWRRVTDRGIIGTSYSSQYVDLPEYTVATLPSASTTSGLIYVSDETGGATVAFSDGTNWLRVQDRAIVS